MPLVKLHLHQSIAHSTSYLLCWRVATLHIIKILSNIHLTAWHIKGRTNFFSSQQMGIRNVSVVHNETISINLVFYHPISDYKIRRFISYTSTHEIYLLRYGVPVGRWIQITHSVEWSHTSVSIMGQQALWPSDSAAFASCCRTSGARQETEWFRICLLPTRSLMGGMEIRFHSLSTYKDIPKQH